MQVVYNADTGFYDGLTRGEKYTVVGENKTQYIVEPNDLGAKSTIQKTKFIVVPESLVDDLEEVIASLENINDLTEIPRHCQTARKLLTSLRDALIEKK